MSRYSRTLLVLLFVSSLLIPVQAQQIVASAPPDLDAYKARQ